MKNGKVLEVLNEVISENEKYLEELRGELDAHNANYPHQYSMIAQKIEKVRNELEALNKLKLVLENRGLV